MKHHNPYDDLNIFKRLGYVLALCAGTAAYVVGAVFMLVWEKIKKLFNMS
tara:strand:+ start:436 stop:585 length:150 start_codon:yes stop_codon:yes gene_type:complete